MDNLTPEQRSEIMGRVKARDTGPEVRVRQLLHAMGYRYRLHVSELPGKPDIVFKSRAKVIFVHGCFWHRHAGCEHARTPKSRVDFWVPKFEQNQLRDKRNVRALRAEGWKVLIVWECEVANEKKLERKMRRFLDEKR